MPAAGVVLIVAVVVIVLALVYYLVSTIVALRQITKGLDDAIAAVGAIVEKSAPVEEVVDTINANLDAAVDALEGLLVKKAGLEDAIGLIDGLYPGAGAAGLRNYEGSGDIRPPRIGEVYTKGTLTLARLGREAPVAMASPDGPAIRNTVYASLSARRLYPDATDARPARSPVIGTDSPVQYEPSDTPGIRPRMPRNGKPTTERTPSADAGAV
jgi:hypothetical protein